MRYRKDYNRDGWPIEDEHTQTILSVDDLVKTLNDYECRVNALENELEQIRINGDN